MSYWDPFLAAVLCAPGWLSIPKLGLFGLDANRFPPTGWPFGPVALPLNADELFAGAVAFPGVETKPAVAVPQWTPAPPPGWPVPVPPGPAKTTPAEGSSRQAPMVSETNRCFFIAGFPSVETLTHQMHPCRAYSARELLPVVWRCMAHPPLDESLPLAPYRGFRSSVFRTTAKRHSCSLSSLATSQTPEP